MNRQEIADRIAGLPAKYVQAHKAADAPIDAEKAQLQAACGEIGHIYRSNAFWICGGARICGVCDHWETRVPSVSGALVSGPGDLVLNGAVVAIKVRA